MSFVDYPVLILVPIITPIVGGVMLYFQNQDKKREDLILITFTILTLISVVYFYIMFINQGEAVSIDLPSLLLIGLSFKLDILALYLGLLVSVIWLLVVVYSLDYMAGDHFRRRFYNFVLLNLSGCLGFFFAGDLLTMFLFFELLTIVSYVLVVHEESEDSIRAGNRYIFLSLIGGLGLLVSTVIIYMEAGTINFATGGVIEEYSLSMAIAFFVFVFSFGIKAGIFPFHVWLPIAHPIAPSPASAILSGIMIKTGAYGILRIMYNIYDIDLIRDLGWNKILLVIAGITIFLGSAGAIFEYDLKKRLAYSSISQMGYILLGMSFLNVVGLVGNIFHITAHAIMKSCLFLAAGAIIYKTGKKDVRELSGIGREMPFTMVSFSLAALAMIGIPPLNGFISKWELSIGALQAGYPLYVGLLLLSSLMNAIYYFPIINSAFFGNTGTEASDGPELSKKMLYPIVILAAGTIVFGLLPYNYPLTLAQEAAELLMP